MEKTMDRDEIETVCTRALAKLGFRLMRDTSGSSSRVYRIFFDDNSGLLYTVSCLGMNLNFKNEFASIEDLASSMFASLDGQHAPLKTFVYMVFGGDSFVANDWATKTIDEAKVLLDLDDPTF
jgi:hypothetical protein